VQEPPGQSAHLGADGDPVDLYDHHAHAAGPRRVERGQIEDISSDAVQRRIVLDAEVFGIMCQLDLVEGAIPADGPFSAAIVTGITSAEAVPVAVAVLVSGAHAEVALTANSRQTRTCRDRYLGWSVVGLAAFIQTRGMCQCF
jgi:hypothetical protein